MLRSDSPPHHAVVLGSSMAGLLAARVLAEHFERVTIVEPDPEPRWCEARRGAPQTKFAHLLLSRGKEILEHLFPGYVHALESHGAVRADLCRDARWMQFGYWKQRFPSSLEGHYCSRTLMDSVVLERLKRDWPNVEFRYGRKAVGLMGGAKRITGAYLVHADSDTREELAADLVVDATGRGTSAGNWFHDLGLPKPRKEEMRCDAGYATRTFENIQHDDWKLLILYPRPPAAERLGLITPLENNQWMVTLAGWCKDYPPTDLEGFLDFTKTLPTLDMYNALKDATPIGDGLPYRMRGNLRRHWGKIPNWPKGFVVMGDAVCSFTPLYAQGMTVAALQALHLQETLERVGARDAMFERRALKGIVGIGDQAWFPAVTEDLRIAGVEGRRSLLTKFLHWYGIRIGALCEDNKHVQQTFIKVINMAESPAALFHPRILSRVLLRPAA